MKAQNNIFLFYGDEDYLIDCEVKRLVPRGAGALNLEVIDGEDVSVSDIVNLISSTSLLSSEKFVVIKDPWFLKSQKARGARSGGAEEESEERKDGVKQLIPPLGFLSGGVKVIFVVYGSVDKRKKIFNVIERLGAVKEFKPFADWEQEKLLSWIMEEGRSKGKKIGSHACRLLMEISGSNLRALSSEIEKIVTFIGDKDAIGGADVEAIASSGGVSVFSLLGSLRERNVASSLRSLNKLIRNREEPASLLSLIATQFRMMLQIKGSQEMNLGESEIARRLGANPYFVRRCAEGAHNYSLAELKDCIFTLHSADLKLKSGFASPPVLLELMIIDMLKKPSEAALRRVK